MLPSRLFLIKDIRKKRCKWERRRGTETTNEEDNGHNAINPFSVVLQPCLHLYAVWVVKKVYYAYYEGKMTTWFIRWILLLPSLSNVLQLFLSTLTMQWIKDWLTEWLCVSLNINIRNIEHYILSYGLQNTFYDNQTKYSINFFPIFT